MNLSVRRRLVFISLAAFALMLSSAVYRLPSFGQGVGDAATMLNQMTVAERRVLNVVTAVNFDYRALDTLGEEFVLFAAVAGVALLLRAQRAEQESQGDDEAPGREVPQTSEAVRVTSLGLIGCTIMWGLFVVLHGHLTPGGGVQGGVILATALLLVYLTSDHTLFQRVTPIVIVQAVESVGVGGYVLLGMIGVFYGMAFLQNVLPLARPGQLYAGGLIPLINIAGALAVGAGLVLLLVDFLEQVLQLRLRRK
jgi:multicomponent Na+:H+ antiporter subunit B